MVDRMNLSEFTDYAAEHIREYMPDSYHDAAVTVNRVLKDGDEVYTGLSLRRDIYCYLSEACNKPQWNARTDPAYKPDALHS